MIDIWKIRRFKGVVDDIRLVKAPKVDPGNINQDSAVGEDPNDDGVHDPSKAVSPTLT